MHDLTTLVRWNRAGALAATAILVAACGGGATTTTAPTTAATQPPASMAETPEASPEASQSAEGYEVELGDSAKYGKFLTGEDGKTLYLFTPDTATTSACNAGCIDSWPAFTLDAGETVKGGNGVTGTFTTIKRQDGGMQVVYDGHPLYYYGADMAAGDTNGEGLFGKWYLIDASGKQISGAKSGGGGKY